MDCSSCCSELPQIAEQAATTSNQETNDKPKRNNYQRRSFWIQAKRIFRKRLLVRRTRSSTESLKLTAGSDTTTDIQKTNLNGSESSGRKVQRLLAPVLQQVFPYLDIYDRIRLRRVCRLTEEIFERSLISLPPIKMQGISLDDIEIWTEHSDLIIQLLVPELDFVSETSSDGIVTVKDWQAELIVQRIATHVDRIEHLWLETAINGELCSALLKGIRTDLTEARWRLLRMDKLTVVGSDEHDCEMISQVVGQFAQSLRELCFRHISMDFGLFCEEFWEAVKQCQQLQQLQYQTCRLDSFSHMHVQQALAGKDLITLELGGVEYLSGDILSKLLTGANIRNLAVICPRISFQSYLEEGIDEVLKKLNTLLVQCPASFELRDVAKRECVIKLLERMPKGAVLEVVHVTGNSAAQAARIMSYWLEIAREVTRKIKLKLSGISQNRVDQAIGRLIRKCGNVFKLAFKGSSLLLTRGEGGVYILDRYTWFGEDEE